MKRSEMKEFIRFSVFKLDYRNACCEYIFISMSSIYLPITFLAVLNSEHSHYALLRTRQMIYELVKTNNLLMDYDPFVWITHPRICNFTDEDRALVNVNCRERTNYKYENDNYI